MLFAYCLQRSLAGIKADVPNPIRWKPHLPGDCVYGWTLRLKPEGMQNAPFRLRRTGADVTQDIVDRSLNIHGHGARDRRILKLAVEDTFLLRPYGWRGEIAFRSLRPELFPLASHVVTLSIP